MALFRILAFLAALAAAGCAGVPRDVQQPEVRLTDIELQPGSGVLEQSMLLVLNVRNPNNFDIPLDGMRFDLELNGRHFAQGLSSDATTIPRLGERRVTATASTNMVRLIEQMMRLAQKGGIGYRLTGDAFLGGAGGRTVPFETDGEFRLAPEPEEPGLET